MENSQNITLLRQALKDYPGYEQTEDRRISDETLRAYMASSLAELLSHVQSLQEYLSVNRKETLARRVGQTVTQIEFLYDKMHLAPYHASPFFTSPRLPQDIQDCILSNDLDLLGLTRKISDILEPTLDEETDFASLIDSLGTVVTDVSDKTDVRISTITEFFA